MTARGIKLSYSVGELVLCFEPDPTKARVLYDAKVLDTTVIRDPEGQRNPAYHVHFQGWNSSWDRVVAEDHVLKNSEENRQLMRNLADAAKKHHKNKGRKRKIEEILSNAFNGNPPVFDSESEDSEEDKGEDGESADDSEASSSQSDDRKSQKKQVELEIPDMLKRVLERDYLNVNKENKLVKLPADTNVINILESFVKAFSVKLLCEPEKFREGKRGSQKIPVDRGIPLCKELVDGLRICFDFTLPVVLLYGAEKDQYTRISTIYKHKPLVKKESTFPKLSPAIQSPTRRSSSRKHPLSPSGEQSPKLPKLSPKIIKTENEDEMVLTPRRLTRRQAHHDSSSKASDTQPGPSTKPTPNKKVADKKDEHKSSRETRRNRKPSGESSQNLSEKSESQTLSGSEKGILHRSNRPPPLLMPCGVTDALPASTQENSQQGSESMDSGAAARREDLMESVLSWKLLPPEICEQTPTPPSLLYGSEHLLRLFVKLPELISGMNMATPKLKALLKMLDHFLKFLSDRHEEIFIEASYVPAENAY